MSFPPATDIRKIRVGMDITQAELAARSGVGQSTIAKIERGKISASYDTVVRLFETLEDRRNDIGKGQVASHNYGEVDWSRRQNFNIVFDLSPATLTDGCRGLISLTNGNCAYWVASVKIKHASQLRTMAANRYDATGETYGDKIAKRVNETDHLHSRDLERLQEMMEAIWLSQKCILSDEP